ncbi:MAG: DUF4268 domain-containing protein [Candidatus Borkfalkiaceae bacterium]|nr:DUF4268 domain-containing protein [Christensenellaceae bacterium]
MRCDAKTEQKRFWKIFDEKLVENGEPFSIVHEKSGMVTYWAIVNKNNILVDNCISLDLLVREEKLRINIYIRDDLAFYNYLERNKQDIESMVSVPLSWIKGERNSNTRRIAFFKPVEIGNVENYAETIDEVLPVIMEMKQVCQKYGKHIFFDF